MKTPTPSRREEIALFRLGVVGDLLARDLRPGELQAELQERALRRYRPPGAKRTRTYHWKTLQRWYHAAKKRSPRALEPASRAKGHGRALSPEQRELLLAMRRHHRSAAAELILKEAVRHGVVAEDQVSLSTVRRLYRDAGLPRVSRKRPDRADVQRRRWQAAKPGDLWHADVCHLVLSEGRRALVHGFLDDASRFFVALAARAHEQERDMLEVFCGALLKHPPPRTLYLDYVSRNIIQVLWPLRLCGDPACRRLPLDERRGSRPHNHRASSQLKRSGSERHAGSTAGTCGASQARNAASLAVMSISA